jgi:hypothetical protein
LDALRSECDGAARSSEELILDRNRLAALLTELRDSDHGRREELTRLTDEREQLREQVEIEQSRRAALAHEFDALRDEFEAVRRQLEATLASPVARAIPGDDEGPLVEVQAQLHRAASSRRLRIHNRNVTPQDVEESTSAATPTSEEQERRRAMLDRIGIYVV